jgi:MoaA/NifB/PqqE/SkfB family radical SAM enzyme
LPTCRLCPLATLCGAGCRSENLLYTGDADQPSQLQHGPAACSFPRTILQTEF